MEIPAGMIDSQSFAGAAAEEIEETGLVIPKTELLDLTELALGKQVRPDDLRTSPFIPFKSPSPIKSKAHLSFRIGNVSQSRRLR